jgi:hypothetical protein
MLPNFVLKNPSIEVILAKTRSVFALRGVVLNGETFWGYAGDWTHDQIADQMGIEKTLMYRAFMVYDADHDRYDMGGTFDNLDNPSILPQSHPFPRPLLALYSAVQQYNQTQH